jgi:hypothetical protein
MKTHFGLKLGESKYGHKLTRDNYAIINKKSSLGSLSSFIISSNKRYEKIPKEWVIWYLSRLLDHYESLLEREKKGYINYIEFIKEELERYQSLPEDYHISVLEKEWNNDKTITLEEYVKDCVERYYKFINRYDLGYDVLGRYYTDEWCQKHLKDAFENFDLNMQFFSMLDHNEFNSNIDNFLKNNSKFKEIYDLNSYMTASGYYILIADQYCQFYIGTSNTIGKRIKQHWNNRKSFDRLLFPIGGVNTSIISFDSYRALDTTRILIYETHNVFNVEDKIINSFNPDFVGNRIGGGLINGGLIQAISMMKSRKLK